MVSTQFAGRRRTSVASRAVDHDVVDEPAGVQVGRVRRVPEADTRGPRRQVAAEVDVRRFVDEVGAARGAGQPVTLRVVVVRVFAGRDRGAGIVDERDRLPVGAVAGDLDEAIVPVILDEVPGPEVDRRPRSRSR